MYKAPFMLNSKFGKLTQPNRMRFLILISILLIGAVTGRNVFKSIAALRTDELGYKPCMRHVGVYFDTSNSLSADTYKNLQQFLSDQFFQNFNHFERATIGNFEGSDVSWNNFGPGSLPEIQEFIETQPQSNVDVNYGDVFQKLADAKYHGWNMPRAIIIFTGKLDADDAKAADQYAEQMKKNGVFLSVIGVQETVDVKVLDKLADFSYVFDVDGAVPDDIQDVLAQANSCDV